MDEKSKTVLEKAKKDKVKFIQLHFTDIFGMIKSVTIPIAKFEESLDKGVWFDGSSIEGFTRIAESDMYLKPDPRTYALIPWETGHITARLICDVFNPDGKPFEGDPRYILKRACREAAKLGFRYNVGPELEFFLFQRNNNNTALKPVPQDIGGYFDFAPRDLASEVRRDAIYSLERFGLEVEMSHHEVAPGQHEIDFKYDDALRTADNAITLKFVIKSIAHSHNLHATFMPKPIFGINGSGMHVHQSLFDLRKKQNAFYDKADKYRLSETARRFIAGQLLHAKALSAVVSPTINSYKRLVSGYEAPVYICWAQINRSALIRIPKYSRGRKESTRAELRCPDPSANPYLAFAVMLTAGLDGIKRKSPLPEPVEEDVYEFNDSKLKELNIDTLPGSLYEALLELKKGETIFNSLGPHSKDIYFNAKMKEWDAYKIQVSRWELKQYLETT